MKEIKNVLICGIGAVGTLYAEKIQKSTVLKVLVDKQRLEKYLKNPIIFNGKELNFDYILPDEKGYKADLIVIATKYTGLKEAVQNIENFVKEDTIILSLLNGVTSEKIIAAKYGREKVLYSYFIGHSSVRDGRNITHDDVNTLVFGSPENSENVERVKEFLERADIHYEIPEDILHSLWLKYMLNVSTNQISAILHYTFGDIFDNKKCLDFVRHVMEEVQLIAKAEGVNNTEIMVEEAFNKLYTMCREGKTSMLQDVEAGRKTEVDMFAGTMIELGEKHNIPTPYNQVLKEIINIIEG